MNKLKSRLKKRDSIIVNISILLIAIIGIVLAYNFPDSALNIVQLKARNSQDSGIHSSAKMIEFKGESFIPDSQIHSDDITRAAAIIDAVRLYSQYQSQQEAEIVPVTSDTTRLEFKWGQMTLLVKSVKTRGLLATQEIRLQMTTNNDPNQINLWVVNNKKFAYSNLKESEILTTLSDQIILNGAKLTGGSRIGRSIWQEKIYFPELID